LEDFYSHLCVLGGCYRRMGCVPMEYLEIS
jgi:hypothetical protein